MVFDIPTSDCCTAGPAQALNNRAGISAESLETTEFKCELYVTSCLCPIGWVSKVFGAGPVKKIHVQVNLLKHALLLLKGNLTSTCTGSKSWVKPKNRTERSFVSLFCQGTLCVGENTNCPSAVSLSAPLPPVTHIHTMNVPASTEPAPQPWK